MSYDPSRWSGLAQGPEEEGTKRPYLGSEHGYKVVTVDRGEPVNAERETRKKAYLEKRDGRHPPGLRRGLAGINLVFFAVLIAGRATATSAPLPTWTHDALLGVFGATIVFQIGYWAVVRRRPRQPKPESHDWLPEFPKPPGPSSPNPRSG